MSQEQYTAQDIVVLGNMEAVQTRPGMYVGDVDSAQGYHHLLWEILDNSVDEAGEGHATDISVTLCPDGSAIVTDNGRGIPVDPHPTHHKSAAEIVLTTLHAGGKFSQKNYKSSGGLHGVGAAVVNALSTYLHATIHRGGYAWTLKFQHGAIDGQIEQGAPSDAHGTTIHFMPNQSIMRYARFDPDVVRQRIHMLSYLCKGVHFHLITEDGAQEDFFSTEGTKDFIRFSTEDKTTVCDPINFTGSHQHLHWDIAWTWTNQRGQDIRGYTNTIPQSAGGHHVAGMLEGLWKGFRQWVQVAFEGKKIPGFSPEDVRDGLHALISVHIPEPRFSSQTKDKLVSAQVHGPIEQAIADEFAQWMEIHPDEASAIFQHIRQAALGREAGERARNAVIPDERNIALSYGKLEDCLGRNPEQNELYLIEGDSAGGTVKKGRDRQFQAILPLRGKILNIERIQDNPKAAFASKEINAIIAALRCGVPGTAGFNIDQLRYHQVVLMTDADVDGSHIRCLLITFFYRYYKELIERGYLYIAQPPLYRLSHRRKDYFIRDEASLAETLYERGTTQRAMDGRTGKEILQYMHPWIHMPSAIEPVRSETMAPASLIDAIIGTPADATFNEQNFIDHMNHTDEDHQWYMGDTGYIECWAYGTMERFHLPTIMEAIQRHNAPRPSEPNTWTIQGSDGTVVQAYGPYDALQHIARLGQEGCRITRYKGIGEMNADTMWETTINPDTRIFRRVSIQDADEADKIIRDLMGDDSEPRKALLTSLNINTVDIDA